MPWADPKEKPSPKLKEKGKKEEQSARERRRGFFYLWSLYFLERFAPRYEQGKPVEGFKAARRVQRSMVREVFRSGVRVRKSISYLRGSVVVAYEVTCYYRRFAASLWVAGIHEHYVIDIKICRICESISIFNTHDILSQFNYTLFINWYSLQNEVTETRFYYYKTLFKL